MIMNDDSEFKKKEMSAKIYVIVLNENLSIILNVNSLFIQNYILIHKANKIKKFFKNNNINIFN